MSAKSIFVFVACIFPFMTFGWVIRAGISRCEQNSTFALLFKKKKKKCNQPQLWLHYG